MRLSTLPALALAGFLLTLLASPPQTARAATVTPDFTVTFGYTGNFETFTVPATGLYNITANGAQGGKWHSISGGHGARIGGDFLLTQGDQLRIAVGQAGKRGGSAGGGSGGGGSFVVAPGDQPLIIAGGGGGAFIGGGQFIGGPGLAGTAGGDAIGVGNTGGTLGNGGGGGSARGSGGGGGFFTNGNDGFDEQFGLGGKSYFNGLAGGWGSVDSSQSIGHPLLGGGFGGGGGAGRNGGGGGGGYSGGAGSGGSNVGGAGGGGGSFNASPFANDNFVNLSGVNAGHGSITITAVPEPTSALAGIAALGGLLLRRRRALASE